MNIMRKLRNTTGISSSTSTTATGNSGVTGVDGQQSGGSIASAKSASGGSPPESPHTQLGLMHLKKLFAEYTAHLKETCNEAERDAKLYNMLPLFCKVRFFNWPKSHR